MQASHCSSFSCCRAGDLGHTSLNSGGSREYGSVVVAHGSIGLVVVVHRLSCPFGSSQSRDRTRPPALAGGFLTTGPPGKSLRAVLFCFLINLLISGCSRSSCRLSLVVINGGYSSLQFIGFSLWWLFLLPSMGSRALAQ